MSADNNEGSTRNKTSRASLNPGPKPRFILDRLLRAWPSLDIRWGSGDQDWTDRLLNWFRAEGKALGVEVYPDPDTKWHAEYLADLVWCIEKGDAYGGLVLALESEWSQSWSDVLDDFDKLLDLKASLKVLLCDPTGPQIQSLPANVSQQIKGHQNRVPGEQYLVIAFDPNAIHAWAFDCQGECVDLGATSYPS
jgi:hypothetical protein